MPLDVVRLALLIAHFIGLAAVIGPFLLQLRLAAPRLRLMLIGAIAQVVTGNALIASIRIQGQQVDELEMIIKLGIAIVALGLLIIAVVVQRRRSADSPGVRPLFRTVGVLALVDIVIAVTWR